MKKLSSKKMISTKGGIFFELLVVAVMLISLAAGIYVGIQIGANL